MQKRVAKNPGLFIETTGGVRITKGVTNRTKKGKLDIEGDETTVGCICTLKS